MEIKPSHQSGGNPASGLAKAATEAERAQSAGKGQKAAEESSRKKAVQQTAAQAQDKTIFALDSENRVVIQRLDANGKVLQQIPSEEFGPVAKELKALMKNIFSREA